MTMKKVVSLALALLMAVSLLAGCGGGGTPDTPDASGSGTKEPAAANTDKTETKEVTLPLAEPIKFTAMAGMNGEYPMSDHPAMKKALEYANIEVDFTDVLGADLAEKSELILASGKYPDFFYKAGIDTAKYGQQQGLLIPLEDLIREYAPNLTALLDEKDGWKYITAADGHVYGLPEIDTPSAEHAVYWINQRWMDNLGLKEPTSYDELYEVLKAFKEQDANGNGDPNDEIPLFCDTYLKPFLLMEYSDIPYATWDRLAVIDGELTYFPAHEKFRELLEYTTKLYAEGLLYEHCFTTDHDQAGAIGQSGDILGSFFDWGAFLTVGRDNDDDYVILTPWDDCLPINSGIGSDNGFVITDKCEHPEVLIAWMDYFYTQEGAQLAWLGVEGESWQYNDKGEWEWILADGEDISTHRAKATLQGGTFAALQPDIWLSSMAVESDPDEAYLNEQRLRAIEHGRVPLPKLFYTEEQRAELSTLRTDADAYVDQYMAQVITGSLSLEDSWDSYLATLEAMESQRLHEIYQEVYKTAQ